MNDPGSDDKIQQLVKAVLDAVDARLDAVRHDLAQFSADVERRHHETLIAVAALERRVAHLEQEHTDHTAAASTVRERVGHLQERVDALEAEATRPVHVEPIEAPTADYSQLSRPLYHGPATSQQPIVTDPAVHELTAPPIPPTVQPTMGPTPASALPHAHSAPPMFRTVEPLRDASTTGPVPTAGAATATAPDTPTTGDGDDTGEIDVERLTQLLDERLSHLHIPLHDDL